MLKFSTMLLAVSKENLTAIFMRRIQFSSLKSQKKSLVKDLPVEPIKYIQHDYTCIKLIYTAN